MGFERCDQHNTPFFQLRALFTPLMSMLTDLDRTDAQKQAVLAVINLLPSLQGVPIPALSAIAEVRDSQAHRSLLQ